MTSISNVQGQVSASVAIGLTSSIEASTDGTVNGQSVQPIVVGSPGQTIPGDNSIAPVPVTYNKPDPGR